MALIGEVAELLRRWDVWKRVEAVPDRVDALERRVAELEAKIAARPAPETCPICEKGEMKVVGVRPHHVFGDMGVQERSLKCNSCGHSEDRQHDPMGRIGKAR